MIEEVTRRIFSRHGEDQTNDNRLHRYVGSYPGYVGTHHTQKDYMFSMR